MGTTDVKEFIIEVNSNKAIAKKIIDMKETSMQKARYGQLSLPQPLETALDTIGIERLYSHQVEAIKAIRKRKNIIISTPTASGKTLIYHLSTLEAILDTPMSTALYIFPTKALVKNQLLELNNLIGAIPNSTVTATKYDGDTDLDVRNDIRKSIQPNIILTTPDMVHASFLQHHKSWNYFYSNLRFIIIDEIHTYRGIFGSHVANIMRRMNLVCNHYHSDPQYITATATIANPLEFVETLTGKPNFQLMEENGAPSSKKHFLFWNPYSIPDSFSEDDTDEDSVSGNKNKDARDILLRTTSNGLQSICFTNSRYETEMIKMYCDDEIEKNRNYRELAGKISAYRSGYLQDERTEIEDKLLGHELEGVISTNALELGINIGHLDVCLLSGYPGTMCSTWQRAGRVGRKNKDALVVFIAAKDALNQYLVNHSHLFNVQNPAKTVESAIIDPNNTHILRPHLMCAAKELFLPKDYPTYFGIDSVSIVKKMLDDGILETRNHNLYSPFSRHTSLNIRSIGDSYDIYHLDEKIGTTNSPIVFRECYPNAIYLHNGREYLVEELDTTEHIVRVKEKAPGLTITRPNISKEIVFMDVESHQSLKEYDINFGTVQVTEHVIGYYIVNKFNLSDIKEEIEFEDPNLIPKIQIVTKGLWMKFDKNQFDMELGDIVDGTHGIEHNIISLLPLFVMCDSRDIGGFTFYDGEKVVMVIYDGHDGGVGYTKKVYKDFRNILKHSFTSISQCKCSKGCPFCIMASGCGNGNKDLDKSLSKTILGKLIVK